MLWFCVSLLRTTTFTTRIYRYLTYCAGLIHYSMLNISIWLSVFPVFILLNSHLDLCIFIWTIFLVEVYHQIGTQNINVQLNKLSRNERLSNCLLRFPPGLLRALLSLLPKDNPVWTLMLSLGVFYLFVFAFDIF